MANLKHLPRSLIQAKPIFSLSCSAAYSAEFSHYAARLFAARRLFVVGPTSPLPECDRLLPLPAPEGLLS